MREMILTMACLSMMACGPVDEGWMTTPSGVELRPQWAPYMVRGDVSLEVDHLEHLLPEVVAWWNDQVGLEVFTDYDPARPAETDVWVQEGQLPEERNSDLWSSATTRGGEAQVRTTTTEDFAWIRRCQVTLNVDLAYDEDTMRTVLRHELGHCLGLADDPGIDVTVDLRSVMGAPVDPLGELTDLDRDLLVNFLTTR